CIALLRALFHYNFATHPAQFLDENTHAEQLAYREKRGPMVEPFGKRLGGLIALWYAFHGDDLLPLPTSLMSQKLRLGGADGHQVPVRPWLELKPLRRLHCHNVEATAHLTGLSLCLDVVR